MKLFPLSFRIVCKKKFVFSSQCYLYSRFVFHFINVISDWSHKILSITLFTSLNQIKFKIIATDFHLVLQQLQSIIELNILFACKRIGLSFNMIRFCDLINQLHTVFFNTTFYRLTFLIFLIKIFKFQLQFWCKICHKENQFVNSNSELKFSILFAFLLYRTNNYFACSSNFIQSSCPFGVKSVSTI